MRATDRPHQGCRSLRRTLNPNPHQGYKSLGNKTLNPCKCLVCLQVLSTLERPAVVLLDSWRFPATTPAGISEDLDITKRLDAFLAANITVVAGSGSGLSTYSEWHWCSERTALQVHVRSAHALLFAAQLAAGHLPAASSDRGAQGRADAAPLLPGRSHLRKHHRRSPGCALSGSHRRLRRRERSGQQVTGSGMRATPLSPCSSCLAAASRQRQWRRWRQHAWRSELQACHSSIFNILDDYCPIAETPAASTCGLPEAKLAGAWWLPPLLAPPTTAT